MNKKLFWFLPKPNATNSLLTNLISYWNFDSGASDVKGLNNGTLINSPTLQAGLINNGYLFASTKYISVPVNGTLSFGNGTTDTPFSYSFWINATTFSGACAPIWKRDTGTTNEYSLSIQADGTLVFSCLSLGGTGAYISITTTSSVGTGSWNHIVITYDGSKAYTGLSAYINSVKSAVTNSSLSIYVAMGGLQTSPLAIGGLRTTFNVSGMLDEIGVWGKSLTQGDVNSLYNGGSGLSYSSFS
jgi:hypothetical protein